MKKTSLLFLLFALLAFMPPFVQSVHSLEKPKETKVWSKSLSPEEIREFNKNIEWIQKNSSEMDRRMFDLGSKQFEISSMTMSNNWSLLGLVLAIVATFVTVAGTLLYMVLQNLVLGAAEKRIEEKVKEAMDRIEEKLRNAKAGIEEQNLFLKTIIYRGQTYLALGAAEEHRGELRNKYVELAIDFAEDSHSTAKALVESMTKDNPDSQKYKDALDTAQGNLAYALSQKESPTEGEKKRARRLAETLYEHAIENNKHHRIDTYAWVLILCGANEDEKKQGRQILKDLILRKDLSPTWRAARFKKYYQLFGEDP